jgi:hypothetical protein
MTSASGVRTAPIYGGQLWHTTIIITDILINQDILTNNIINQLKNQLMIINVSI